MKLFILFTLWLDNIILLLATLFAHDLHKYKLIVIFILICDVIASLLIYFLKRDPKKSVKIRVPIMIKFVRKEK